MSDLIKQLNKLNMNMIQHLKLKFNPAGICSLYKISFIQNIQIQLRQRILIPGQNAPVCISNKSIRALGSCRPSIMEVTDKERAQSHFKDKKKKIKLDTWVTTRTRFPIHTLKKKTKTNSFTFTFTTAFWFIRNLLEKTLFIVIVAIHQSTS